MNPYDEVINALRTLFARSGPQLGRNVVLTEKDLPRMMPLMQKLDEDSSFPLRDRIRAEIPGAGTRFHTVTIKFPGVGAYEIPLDDE
jgi:hypothetical protein